MRKVFLLSINIFLLFISCSKNEDSFFYEELVNIKQNMPTKTLHDFASREELSALGFAYIDRDSFFRKETLKMKKNEKIIKFFNSKGIKDNKDIQKIIFTSLHRNLNSKKIKLHKQISDIISIERETKNCIDWQKKNLFKNNSLKVKDIIIIRLKIGLNNECEYPKECYDSKWVFSNYNDYLVKGKIKNIYSYNSISSEILISVEILDLNKKDIKILGKVYKKGDELEISLNYNIIDLK